MSKPVNRAGPMMGAAIIGCGIGYFIFQKTGNIFYAVGAAFLITFGDYIFVMAINRFFKKDK